MKGFRLGGDNALAALRAEIDRRSQVKAEVVDTGAPSKAALLHAEWKRREAPRTVAPAPLERDVQAAILELLRAHPRVAWSARMNTGAMHIDDRFVRFAFPGCPDILGQLKGGRFLAIEVKRPGGKGASPDQVAFLTTAARHGALAFVARSVDDVIAMLGDPPAAA